MVQNALYLNGLQSHVTLPFEYWTPIQSGIQMNLVFIWFLYLKLRCRQTANCFMVWLVLDLIQDMLRFENISS